MNRPVVGWIAALINYLNSIKAFKIAVDMPSG
ncbi:MAG: NAD(P)H-hydrate epimerase [Nonlabens sp.]|jgi:NAD(P)H-hydrate epimerase